MGWEDRPYYRDRGGSTGNRLTGLLTGSVPLFTAFGIRVRAHASLVLAAALVLLLGFRSFGDSFSSRLEMLSALFLVVLLHEFGHCFTARWVGGQAADIMMTPLGGLAFAHPPRRPLPTFLTIAGGPAVNVVICIVVGIYLHVIGWKVPINLFDIGWARHPSLRWFELSQFLFLLFTVSWAIFLFNLWPVYPLDGGQMLHSILWPHFGYHKSMKFSTVTGMIGAGVMFVLGLFSSLMLSFIAVSCFLICYQMFQQLKHTSPWDMDGPDEIDYSASIYGKDPKPSRKKKNWFARRAASIEEERVEQQKIDTILAKVSAQGMQSLTWLEKRTLRQATENQRKRDVEYARQTRT